MKKNKWIFSSLSDSKNINKVLANDTARSILEKLSKEPLSTTQLSKKLSKPLTTIDYNLKNLKEANLVKLSKRAISEKGRVIDLWEPENKFILISPLGREKVLEVLKKGSPYIGISLILSIILESFSYSLTNQPKLEAAGSDIMMYAVDEGTRQVTYNPHYGIIFFLVSIIGIILFLLLRNKTLK